MTQRSFQGRRKKHYPGKSFRSAAAENGGCKFHGLSVRGLRWSGIGENGEKGAVEMGGQKSFASVVCVWRATIEGLRSIAARSAVTVRNYVTGRFSLFFFLFFFFFLQTPFSYFPLFVLPFNNEYIIIIIYYRLKREAVSCAFHI